MLSNSSRILGPAGMSGWTQVTSNASTLHPSMCFTCLAPSISFLSGMPAPAQHVADSWQSAEFYANKLMMALKGKDEVQMAWLKSLKVGCMEQ